MYNSNHNHTLTITGQYTFDMVKDRIIKDLGPDTDFLTKFKKVVNCVLSDEFEKEYSLFKKANDREVSLPFNTIEKIQKIIRVAFLVIVARYECTEFIETAFNGTPGFFLFGANGISNNICIERVDISKYSDEFKDKNIFTLRSFLTPNLKYYNCVNSCIGYLTDIILSKFINNKYSIYQGLFDGYEREERTLVDGKYLEEILIIQND